MTSPEQQAPVGLNRTPTSIDSVTLTSLSSSGVKSSATAQNPWSQAVRHATVGLKSKDLSDILQIATYDDLLEKLYAVQREHERRLLPRLLLKMAPFLGVMRSFSSAISICINSNPKIAALIWGGIKVLVELTIRSVETIEKVIEVLNDIATHLPRFERYATLFEGELQLESALINVYVDIIGFLLGAIKFFRRNSILNLVRALWTSFEGEFAPLVRRIKFHSECVEMEAFAANIARGERRHEDLMKLLSDNKADPQRTVQSCHKTPHAAPPNFHGRVSILQSIERYFVSSSAGSCQGCYVLTGIAGVGKTQTALRYVYDNLQQYPYIFWTAADTDTKLLNDFQHIAALLELDKAAASMAPTKARDLVLQYLQSPTTPRWLIVFDNVESLEIIRPFWPKCNGGSIIITTRYPDLGCVLSAETSTVLPFSQEEGAELILRLTNKGNSEGNVARTISAKLGGLALGIAHVAGFIREAGLDLSEFKTMYNSRQDQIDIHSMDQQLATFQYERSFSTVWSMSFATLADGSRLLLDILFFLDPDEIPESLLNDGFKTGKAPEFQLLRPPLQLIAAITMLYRRALIQRNAEEHTLSVHRLVQLEKSRSWSSVEYQRNFDLATELLDAAFPPHNDGQGMTQSWLVCSKYAKHVLSLCDRFNCEVSLIPSLSFFKLVARCGWYLYERGLFTPSLQLLELAERLSGQYNVDKLVVAEIYTGLASAYKCVSQKEKAYSAAQQVVSIREDLLGPQSILLANSLNDYGIIANDLDQLDEAAVSHARAISIKESCKDCPEVLLAQSYSNLGRTLTRLGQLDEASRLLEKAVALRSRNFGLLNRYTSVSIYALGNVRIAQKRLDEALKLHIQCLRIRREVLGAGAFYTGLSCYKVAVLRHAQDAPLEALDLFAQASAIFENIPEVKADLARANFMRAQLLKQLGRDNEGAIFLQQAQTIFSQLRNQEPLGHETSDDYDQLTAYDNR